MSPEEKSPNCKDGPPELNRAVLEQASKNQLIDLVLLLQEQCKQIAVLKARVAELERRLGMNSSNSSMPPSSDPPQAKAKRRNKKKSKRKRGAQPGHEGHHRALVPVDQVNALDQIAPECCELCGSTNLEIDCSDPWRHQIWDIPPVKPTISENQMFRGLCLDCDHVTTAKLPEGVPSGNFGPRLQSLIGMLTGVYHLSKRQVQCLLQDLLSTPICLGSITACEKAVSQAVEQPVEQAHQFIQISDVLYADETSWRQCNRKVWLWVAVSPLVTVFLICLGRGRQAARKLLGNFKGILVSDRWKPYRVHKGLRQFCWAHLLRAFIGFSEMNGKACRIGQQLADKTLLMFQWWHRIRDGTLSHAGFRRKMKKHRIEVEDLLIEGEMCGQSPMAGSCKEILSEGQHLWTFVDHEGVEPTNNTSERAVRQGVLWRKVSYGTQSEEGSRFVERIMTVAATCRQQDRNILEYLNEACLARLHHREAPSLLPSAAQTP